MRWDRTRRRVRVVIGALAALVAIYRRDRNLSRILSGIWRVTLSEGPSGIRARLIGLTQPKAAASSVKYTLRNYGAWAERFDSLSDAQVEAARSHLATLRLPEILILLIVTPEAVAAADQILASWRSSIHAGWHAGLVVPPGLAAPDRAALAALSAAEPRLALLSTPEEIDRLSRQHAQVLLCFGAVLLNSLSAYMFAEAALRTGAAILYADSDRIDEAGRRSDPDFKPNVSPDYIARYNYIGDCLCVSCPGGVAWDEPGALLGPTLAEYDRLVAGLVRGREAEHLPFVLSHGLARQPRSPHDPGPDVPDRGPSVAIIIPTRDGLDHLRRCLDSILQKTSYDLDLVEILIVDNDSRDGETRDYLEALARRPGIRVLPYPLPFNFAAINNMAAAATRQEILVLLNDDTEVRDPAWLGKLVAHARRPEIGAVGAKLLFRDGTIQHGGCALGSGWGTLQHLLLGVPAGEVAGTDHTREMSVVTGACLAVRRSVFERVGGLDPVLRVAWNDVVFCLACLEAGYRNIYVADPLLFHDESRSRGRETTPEKLGRFFDEANYTRRRFPAWFLDDPSYNPNRSVDGTGQLAQPPRVRRPWQRRPDRPARILMLSKVHRLGFGVPLVIQQQAAELKARGHEVLIGGPASEGDLDYPGCERVVLETAKEAAAFAFDADISLVVSHTPPFFKLPVMIGPHIRVLAYDYGEPSPDFFGEPTRSYLREVEHQKGFAAPLAAAVATISQAVKDEGLNEEAIVVGLANSHLAAWSEALVPARRETRRRLGWEGRFVVLTVCRFGRTERSYKGLDQLARIMAAFPYLHPDRAATVTWALAGAGSAEDVAEAEALGFTVFPNVSDGELAGLYGAADAYASFSRWEGYNLGIGQALAMGLPTIASDIPAHREFPIVTTASVLAACRWLAGQATAQLAEGPDRTAHLVPWKRSVSHFADLVEGLLARPDRGLPRFGVPVPQAPQRDRDRI